MRLHQPATPRTIVVKRKRRSCDLTRAPRCIWPGCDARLAHDHGLPVCGCHVSSRYNPHHDRDLPELILHLVTAAYPCAVDLCAVLHCTSQDIRAPLDYLRRREVVIVGARRGYVLELAPLGAHRRAPAARTVKA